MGRGLTLKQYEVEEVTGVWAKQVRLRLEVSNPTCGADVNVFLYRTRPEDPYTGEQQAEVTGIASPFDMAAYPAGIPAPGDHYPHFRLDYIDVIVDSVNEAADLVNTYRSHINILLAALDSLDTLKLVDTSVLGTCEESNSQSDSQSTSDSQSGSV